MSTSMTWQLPGGSLSLTFEGEGPLPTPEQFDVIRAYLDVWSGAAGHTVQQLVALQEEIIAMSAQLDAVKQSITDLEADVASQTSVTSSAIALLNGISVELTSLRQQLADAVADNAQLPEVQARLDALNAQLDVARNDLAAAVVANTPAAQDEPTV